jgi:hypothetical protein
MSRMNTPTPSLFGLTAAFGEPLPELLADLLRFQLADPDPYNEGFELAELDVEDLLPDPPPRDGRRLLPFGVNGHGSAFAIWLEPGQSPEQAPVVYVDADAQADMVIARTLAEFFALLALDQEDPSTMRDLASWREVMIENGWSHSPRWDELVRWLAERHGIEPASDPRKILERAAAAAPGFRTWMGHPDEEPVPEAERPLSFSDALAARSTPSFEALLEGDELRSPRKAAQVAQAAEVAIRGGREDLIARMLEAGLDPELRLIRENTLLLHAALYGRVGCVRVLLEAGADPEATNDLGETADLLATDNEPEVALAIQELLTRARATRAR